MTYDFKFEFIGGDDEASTRALTSLYRWFREDLSAGADTKVELEAGTEPGHMGAADVLCMALTQLTSIGSLAVAFATWRESRSSAPPLRIRLGDATLELTDASDGQLASALHALAAMTDEPGSPVAGGDAADGVASEVGSGPVPSSSSATPEA